MKKATLKSFGLSLALCGAFCVSACSNALSGSKKAESGFDANVVVPAQPVLTIKPAKRLWRDAADVQLAGAPPGEKVELTATLTDNAGQVWSSRGVYYADAFGRVTPATQASLAGTYDGVDANGLFWSMLPVTPDALDDCANPACLDGRPPTFAKLDATKDVKVALSARLGGASAAKAGASDLEAHQMAGFVGDNVAREVIASGDVVGVLYYPSDVDAPPPVILVTGSDGGAYERAAALLASHGFAALALAHFNYEGRPDSLSHIPLEYFESALDLMTERFDRKKAALVGESRGGEGVLLVASYFPEKVSAVVSGVPMNIVSGGCCTPEAISQPAWTLEGEPIPPANYDINEGQSLKDFEASGTDFRGAVLNVAVAAHKTGVGEIPVEQIEAPVLLVGGDADEIWPSAIGVEFILKRLAANDFSYPVDYLNISGAGHLLASDTPIMSQSDASWHPFLENKILLGGVPSINAQASKTYFDKKLEFLKKHAN